MIYLLADDVLSSIEHQPADFELGWMDCSDVDDIDLRVVGQALVTCRVTRLVKI